VAKTEDGINWITHDGDQYVIAPQHRNGSWHSQWSVTTQVEVEIFELASDEAWGDALIRWGFRKEAGEVSAVGSRGEFITKHRRADLNIPWHGYPARPSAAYPQDFPPEDVLEIWASTNVLPYRLVKRILKGTWSL
jgi:hypothetical protein